MGQELLIDTSTETHIVFDDVEVKYSEHVFGLRDVSLRIKPGEFVFFVGQTGTGKSTILKLLSKEIRPTSGTVWLWGVDLETIPDAEIPLLRRSMGIVPQDYGLLPRKNVFENVAYAMRAIGATKREIRKRVPEILEMVNLGHRVDAFPDQLSGGERQRVAIGRALINRPSLLVADEPTGNLDLEHSWGIMELLLELNRRGTTILVASHDVIIVERMGKRVVTMQGGRVASDETPTYLPLESRPAPEADPIEDEDLADLEPSEGVEEDDAPEMNEQSSEEPTAPFGEEEREIDHA